MKVIGLTGGIASGKSTVSGHLAKLGAIVISGDEVAHQLMEPGQPTWEGIVQAFGDDILNPDLTINRPKLSQIVFHDPAMMARLNEISRKRIIEKIDSEMALVKRTKPDAVLILDIPLLYEARLEKYCDQVWVVWVDRETQVKRLMERNGYTRPEALERIGSQMSLDEKAKRADVVFDNTGTMDETLEMVERYFTNVLTKS